MLEKHFENARIKANTSILIEKVVDLQGELARVKEEKVLVEKNNSNLERQIAQQQRQLSKLKRENDKMTKRIANLEEEKNVAKLDEATSMNFDGVLLSGEDLFVFIENGREYQQFHWSQRSYMYRYRFRGLVVRQHDNFLD